MKILILLLSLTSLAHLYQNDYIKASTKPSILPLPKLLTSGTTVASIDDCKLEVSMDGESPKYKNFDTLAAVKEFVISKIFHKGIDCAQRKI